jgi:hypothetical protein
VGVRLGSGRPAGIELAGEHLEVQQRPRRQQELAPEDPEARATAARRCRSTAARRTVRLEQVGDADAERVRDPAQRRDARARAPALDLAEEALADAGAVGDRLQRGAPEAPDVAEALADVDLAANVGRARRHPDLLRPRRRKT